MLLCFLTGRGGGVPHPVLNGVGGYPIHFWTGVPHPVLDGEYPHLDLGWGTPPVSWMGYPQTWDGVPPQSAGLNTPPRPIDWIGTPTLGQGTPLLPPVGWMGYPPPHLNLGQGTPPCLDLGWGTPLSAGWGTPSRNVDRQTPVKIVPSLVLRTRAVKIDHINLSCFNGN